MLRTLLFIVVLQTITVCKSDKTVGFPRRISIEYKNEECKGENVPTWLKGNFVRYQCAAFGPPKGANKRTITHFFDCLGMVNTFKFENGKVFYSSSYFDTAAYRSWSPSANDFDGNIQPKVTWRTMYTPVDMLENAIREDQGSSAKQVFESTVASAMWQSDRNNCSLVSFSDAPSSFDIDLRNGVVKQSGNLPLFQNQGGNGETFLLHQAPRGCTDPNGDFYGSLLVAQKLTDTSYSIRRHIYRLEFSTRKHTVLNDRLSAVTVDLTRCQEVSNGYWTYRPDPNFVDIGYVVEVALTKTYLILIENPYVFNPCFLLEKARNAPGPFFQKWWSWHTGGALKIYLVNKANGQLKRIVNVAPAFFVSRIVNIAENADDLNYLVIDALTHPDSNVMTQYFDINFLMASTNVWPADATLKRISIDPNSGSVVSNDFTFGSIRAFSAEFTTINENARNDAFYSNVYMVNQPFSDGSSIWKVNLLRGGEPMRWTPDPGTYTAGEVAFVARPRSTKEDDGILLVPTFNSNLNKGFAYILDASNLTQIGRIEAPGLISYGTYGRFFPACTDGAGKGGSRCGATSVLAIIVLFYCLALRIM